MTKKISDTKPIADFIDIANKYCLLVEKRDEKTEIQLLQEMFIILPQLCLFGMLLPDINRYSPYTPPRMYHNQWNELYKSLQYKFTKIDWYKEMFDPYDLKDKEPVNATISDDLADIYRDIKSGLKVWENSNPNQRIGIIWEWKWGFENHWGDHATSAFRALYALLYSHVEDKDGDYIGIREQQ